MGARRVPVVYYSGALFGTTINILGVQEIMRSLFRATPSGIQTHELKDWEQPKSWRSSHVVIF
jgi:hypothetical protein